MNKVLGWILAIGGVLIGLWIGVWVMFIGGIIEVVTALKATDINAFMLAWGIVRIMFAGFVGWFCGIFVTGMGIALLKD